VDVRIKVKGDDGMGGFQSRRYGASPEKTFQYPVMITIPVEKHVKHNKKDEKAEELSLERIKPRKKH
jgi:hypothetical protein